MATSGSPFPVDCVHSWAKQRIVIGLGKNVDSGFRHVTLFCDISMVKCFFLKSHGGMMNYDSRAASDAPVSQASGAYIG